jgi:hypothetical protein
MLVIELINLAYSYAKYSDIKIVINQENHFFNVSKLCYDHNKNYHNWSMMSQTPILIKSFSDRVQTNKSWSIAITGKQHPINGSYIHVRFLPAVMLWLSPKLYLTSVEMVELIESRKMKTVIDNLSSELVTLSRETNDVKAALEACQNELQQQQQQIKDEVEQKPEIKMEVEATNDTESCMSTCFKLVKKNGDDDVKYPYIMFCAQKRNAKKSLKRLQSKFPKCEVILDIPHCSCKFIKDSYKKKIFAGICVATYRNQLKSEFEDDKMLINYINEHVSM